MATPRLKEKYENEVKDQLREKFQYKSVMQVPRLTKIVLNKGIGAAVADKKLVDVGIEELSLITGQKAIATISKKAVSNFKLRENMPIGAKVTLRAVSYTHLDVYKRQPQMKPSAWRRRNCPSRQNSSFVAIIRNSRYSDTVSYTHLDVYKRQFSRRVNLWM